MRIERPEPPCPAAAVPRERRSPSRFLNRGQQWVADCIAAALPRLTNFTGWRPLQAMYDSHLVNIAICKEQMT